MKFRKLPLKATPEMEQAATAYEKSCGGFVSKNPFTWAGCYDAMVGSVQECKIDNEEIEFIASEMSQQDWDDLRFKEIYRKAFIDGAKYFNK